MQPWMIGQQAAQRAAQDAQRAAQQAAQSAAQQAMRSHQSGVDASRRAFQASGSRPYATRSRRRGPVSRLFQFVLFLIWLAIAAGVVAVGLAVLRGR